MKTLLLLLSLSSLLHADLTKEDILKIESKAHVEDAVSVPLQLFTKGREFKTTARTLYAKDKKFKNTLKFKCETKVIDKDTLFSSYTLPGQNEPFRAVITYDSALGLYKKFMITPDSKLRKLRGIAIENTRTIHWSMISPEETTVNIECYSEDSFVAKEAFLDKDGSILMVVEFKAQKIK